MAKKIEKPLMDLLSNNPSTTDNELATKLGVSRITVTKKRNALEKQNELLYFAFQNPGLIKDSTVFCTITFDPLSEPNKVWSCVDEISELDIVHTLFQSTTKEGWLVSFFMQVEHPTDPFFDIQRKIYPIVEKNKCTEYVKGVTLSLPTVFSKLLSRKVPRVGGVKYTRP